MEREGANMNSFLYSLIFPFSFAIFLFFLDIHHAPFGLFILVLKRSL
ncbi:hypothetical protein DJ66_0239 [Candidatus Liberibacter solanacearum]|uniref:Transmembrane protein n=1 Tax=Candidatus Liberibacter solanacearum TaxID=556287 RepID=A0A0F4VMZ8_9HYPH|nr:hypothetical protein DJ66_0239 [Candidatus Liberibacter solanacearum]